MSLRCQCGSGDLAAVHPYVYIYVCKECGAYYSRRAVFVAPPMIPDLHVGDVLLSIEDAKIREGELWDIIFSAARSAHKEGK